MQNQLLKDSNYMSVWHGIEIRVPFLDKELIELVHQIYSSIKAFEGQKKYLLIHALGDKLPRAIWDRPKMGFTFPFEKWLESSEKGDLNSTNPYAQIKLEKGEFTWSRYLAIVMLNWDLKCNP